ncbi:MAG: flagellar hook-basal body complex protein FliE [Spirochaetaceae bacterium]|nr:flagellar hook-basal body complex protein FliE [Spirochaetaceae bacterium]MCF7947859.1 flagellar hook-basal body complex protein FliE [Spirochaetia bacterium]MCF7951693.1 flagellar hook-basal body complex protein FliE [Spirochaetaceae bacterium]
MSNMFSSQVSGHIVPLELTNSRHMTGKLTQPQQQGSEKLDFGKMVFDKLQEANSLTQESTQLSQQFITDPDSVDAHDVTIAMSKANFAVSLTKSVVDGALKAYREISNLR